MVSMAVRELQNSFLGAKIGVQLDWKEDVFGIGFFRNKMKDFISKNQSLQF